MSSSFRFLAHDDFISQVEDFRKSHPDAYKNLLKQFEKSRSDPFRAGRMMRNVLQHLQGKLFRLPVRGKKGFRYIYMVNRELSCVLGVFISPTTRSKFDYSKYPWQKLAEQIHQDLVSGNMHKFQVWPFRPHSQR